MALGAHLVIGVWISKSEKRMQALMNCLDANLKNMHIASASLVIQDPIDAFMAAVAEPKNQGIRWLADRLVHPKVRLVQLGKRPTFQDFFDAADVGNETPVIVAASDLTFDNTLGRLEEADLKDTMVCLSPNGGKGSFRPAVSQSAWIFWGPLPELRCAWHFGLLGSDNKLAHEAWVAGLTVVNPCFDVVAKQSLPVEPDWPVEPRLEGPYLEVHPVGMASVRRKN